MNTSLNVNQLLSQLRTLASQADPGIEVPTQPGTSNKVGPGFGDVLAGALDQVNATQIAAGKATDAYAMGQADLPAAMLAVSHAQVEFRAAVEVRNRFVQAYRDIMQMTM